MKIHTSLKENFKKKKQLIDKNGKIRFNNKKERITTKGMKKSSQQWLNRQLRDPFVNASKIEGYLARSAYKLLEIQDKYGVLNNESDIVIDLGCSPGSWAQVITTNKKTINSYIIGVDLLEPKFHHNNFHFIQGDFEDRETQKKVIDKIKELNLEKKSQISADNNYADCIVCDIAPNNIGNKEIDRIRSERIVEEVLEFCKIYLKNGGNFVCKSIKGADNSVFPLIQNMFVKTHRFKPKSSRKDSSEMFLVGINKKS